MAGRRNQLRSRLARDGFATPPALCPTLGRGRASRCAASRVRWLVQRGIEWHPLCQLVPPALPTEHCAPEAVGILREDVVELGRLDDPVVALELLLELLGPPAGDAGEDAGTLQLRRLAFEGLIERDEANLVQHHDTRVIRIAELGDRGDAVRIHGPANAHLIVDID